jgi:predicted HTH transcriptional regulator
LAALLLFGKEASIAAHVPYCETIVNLHGATTRLRKNLLDSVRDLILTDHSLLRSSCPSVPEETLREILVNAYIHRCWRTNAPILISVDNERLEIANPGDLLPSLTVNSLLYCLPAYRNLLLADGVRIVGLADKIGAGINIIMNTVNIALQRGEQSARKILQGMQDKHMIEPLGGTGYQLTATLRLDITRVFQVDQMDLFGAA